MHIDDNLVELLERLQLNTPLSATELNDALSLLQQTTEKYPAIPIIHYEQGNILRQLGRSKEALAAYDKTAQLIPEEHFVHLARSYALADLQEFDGAIAACEHSLKLLPNEPNALLQHGNLMLHSNRAAEALTAFDKLVKINPKHIDAILRRHHVQCSLNNNLMLKIQIDFANSTTLALATSQNPGTKFGGQPIWLEQPEWPISRTTGKPMQFVAQIAIDQEQFPQAKGKMAYLFMEQNATENSMPAFWESDGGDNAVIIQPAGELAELADPDRKMANSPIFNSGYQAGSLETHLAAKTSKPRYVDTLASATGPAYCEEQAFTASLAAEPIQSKLFEYDLPDLDQTTWTACFEKSIDEYNIDRTKIGGSPFFIQAEEYPQQPDCSYFLCQVNLLDFSDDDGTLYVFLNETATKGAMIYQR